MSIVGDTIQPSHPLLSPSPPALNLSQHQGLFWWVGFSRQEDKVLDLQLQHQSFQWIIRVDFLWVDWGGSLCSPSDSQESFPAPQFKASISWHSTFFMNQLLNIYMPTGKTIALNIWTFVSEVTSLLFNTLSRFVTDFLSRSKCLLIMWLKWFWNPRK